MTDSNFLNLEPFYEFTLANASFNIDEKDWEQTYKIINIISYILGKVIAEAYWTFTEFSNVPEEKRPIIAMKNEFLMSRILLTNGKKNYASNVLLQEGTSIPDYKSLDIKGLPIKKSNVNRRTGSFLMGLLKEEILKSDKIQMRVILEKLSEFEREIKTEFNEGRVTYMTPSKVNEIESYKNPFTQASVRAALAWNAVYPNTPITFPAQVNLVKLKAEKLEDIAFIYDKNPEVYKALKTEIFDSEDLGKYGLKYFAIPKTEENIPSWLVPLIDTDTIVQDNLKNFITILNSIGIKTICTTADSEFYSNLIDF